MSIQDSIKKKLFERLEEIQKESLTPDQTIDTPTKKQNQQSIDTISYFSFSPNKTQHNNIQVVCGDKIKPLVRIKKQQKLKAMQQFLKEVKEQRQQIQPGCSTTDCLLF